MANREILLFCRMLNQTLNYLDHFARFTQKENVEAVERLLSAHKDLAKFERAQLGSSRPSPLCLRSGNRNMLTLSFFFFSFLPYQDRFAVKRPMRPRL